MFSIAKEFRHRFDLFAIKVALNFRQLISFFLSFLTRKGEITYTPRLIAFDLKGSLGSFSNQESADKSGENDILWQGNSEIQRTEPEFKNPFLQQLENQNEGMQTNNLTNIYSFRLINNNNI